MKTRTAHMREDKSVPLAEREDKRRKTRVYRESFEHLKEADERTRTAWEIYNGKLAIAQSWNIDPKYPKLAAKLMKVTPDTNYLAELDSEIRRRHSYLKNRGEL